MKKIVVFFIVIFGLSLILIYSIFDLREKKQKEIFKEHVSLISSEAEHSLNRFLLDVSYDSDLINLIRTTSGLSYEKLKIIFDGFIKKHNYLRSISILSPSGIITGVYPYESNKGAIGLTTQSIDELKSLAPESKRFISQPIDFYQGGSGFGLYSRNKYGSDWMAFLITSDTLEKVILSGEMSQIYYLTLKDEISNKTYLDTSSGKINLSKEVRTKKLKFLDRGIVLQIWPKQPLHAADDRIVPSLFALLLSLISTLAYWWWAQNIDKKNQLEELNHLLRLTIHDTSNSLTAIKGYLEMMKDDPEIVPVERLSKHVSFIIDLLDQIKVMKQLSTNNQDWKMTENSLLQIVLEVSDILSDRFKAKKISLHYNPETLVNVKLNVNRGLFAHSVIGNLLTNAIKFSFESNSISIDYFVEDRFHVIEISDQGEGIGQAEIQKLKTGKLPTSKPGTRGESGSGFGLMIVQQVMALHNGTVEYRNSSSRGTVAKLKLPLT